MRLLALSALLLVTAAHGQEQQSQPAQVPDEALAELFVENHEALTWVINSLSRCAGLYDVLAAMNDPDMPATAEVWRGMSRGARYGAMYLLGQESVWTGSDPKPYGDFKDYVDPIAETSRTRLMALIENAESDSMLKEAEACESLAETQEKIVQMMRDETSER